MSATVIEYQITTADIAAGYKGDCRFCPANLALMRATGEPRCYTYTYVSHLMIRGKAFIANNPPELTEFIKMFDHGLLDGAKGAMSFRLEFYRHHVFYSHENLHSHRSSEEAQSQQVNDQQTLQEAGRFPV